MDSPETMAGIQGTERRQIKPTNVLIKNKNKYTQHNAEN